VRRFSQEEMNRYNNMNEADLESALSDEDFKLYMIQKMLRNANVNPNCVHSSLKATGYPALYCFYCYSGALVICVSLFFLFNIVFSLLELFLKRNLLAMWKGLPSSPRCYWLLALKRITRNLLRYLCVIVMISFVECADCGIASYDVFGQYFEENISYRRFKRQSTQSRILRAFADTRSEID
jgi:hypothetical protein